jgi:hypothetical protein
MSVSCPAVCERCGRPCTRTEPMSDTPTPAIESREYLRLCSKLATGRLRIELAEERLQIDLVDVLNDDDLVVIFADEVKGLSYVH